MKKLLIHWKTTVKGIVYLVLLIMYILGKINTQDWIMATGSILVVNAIWQKDADKVEDKK